MSFANESPDVIIHIKLKDSHNIMATLATLLSKLPKDKKCRVYNYAVDLDKETQQETAWIGLQGENIEDVKNSSVCKKIQEMVKRLKGSTTLEELEEMDIMDRIRSNLESIRLLTVETEEYFNTIQEGLSRKLFQRE